MISKLSVAIILIYYFASNYCYYVIVIAILLLFFNILLYGHQEYQLLFVLVISVIAATITLPIAPILSICNILSPISTTHHQSIGILRFHGEATVPSYLD